MKKETLRSVARDVLPPIVVRTGKRLFGTDPLGITRWQRDRVRLRNGHILHHRGTPADHGVIRQLFVDREYDFRPLTRYDEILDMYDSMAAPLILDCGANIGASAVWFTYVYPKAKVVAIEPEPGNFELLLRNTTDLRATEAVHAAISDHAGVVSIEDPGHGAWAYRTRQDATAGDVASVRAVTIDEIVEQYGGEPFILKIDVEGAEDEVFEQASPILDRFPMVVIELHDWMFPRSHKSRSFLRWHAESDRDFVYRRENVFSIRNPVLDATDA